MRKLVVWMIVAVLLVSNVGAFADDDSRFAGMELNILSIKWDFMESMLSIYAQEIADEMGITLNVSYYTYDESRQKVVADTIASVDTWDLIYVDTKQIPEYAAVGALEPIVPLLEEYPIEGYDFADFSEKALSEASFNDVQYAIPIMSDCVGLVYRTDILNDEGEKAAFLEKYGYELGVPTTYAQYLDICTFFTRKAGDTLMGETLTEDFYGTCHSDKATDFLWHDYITYMYAFGADIYDEQTMMPTWNSPENVAAGEYYQALAATEPSGHINMTSGESMSVFANGNCAMIIEFYSRTLYLGGEGSLIEGKFAFDLCPTQDESRKNAAILSTNFLGVFSGSKKQEMTTVFLQKLTSKETATKLALHTADDEGLYKVGDPLFPRASVMNDPQVLDMFPALTLVLDTLNNPDIAAFNHIRLPEYPEIIEIGGTALSRILEGENVSSAFDKAQKQMEELFQDAGYI